MCKYFANTSILIHTRALGRSKAFFPVSDSEYFIFVSEISDFLFRKPNFRLVNIPDFIILYGKLNRY